MVSMSHKYTAIECTVVGHQPYGLIVQSENDERGFIDSIEISDSPAARGEWPSKGQRLPCVVLGRTKDGRLRLSARQSDVMLVRTVDNVADALAEWQNIRDAVRPEADTS